MVSEVFLTKLKLNGETNLMCIPLTSQCDQYVAKVINHWYIVRRDRPPTRDHISSNMALHFYTFVPQMKDHLSYKTTFCGPLEWSHHTFHCTSKHVFIILNSRGLRYSIGLPLDVSRVYHAVQ